MAEMWTDFECDVLYQHFTDPDYLPKVREILVGRSVTAIRQRMCQLRAEADYTVDRAPRGNELKRNAADGSDALRRAIERTAA